MANWTGTYTITNGATGTSTGGNSSTELRNNGATWPTGAQSLVNFTVRILTGTGAGQSRIITSNTATILTVPAWTITPDATSTYEIVLVFNAAGSDHIVAAVTLSTNIITEIADSSILLFDGANALNFTTNCVVRWGKTLATMPTLQANNRTVQGKFGFYTGVEFLAPLSLTPQFQFIKMLDVAYGMIVIPSVGVGDGSTIRQVWMEGTNITVSMAGAAMAVNMKLSGWYWKNSTSCGIAYPSTLSAGKTCIAEKMWLENSAAGPYTLNATGPTTSIFRESVCKDAASNRNANLGAGQIALIADNYFSSRATTDAILAGANSAAGLGSYIVRNNRSNCGRAIYGAAVTTATIASAFNDWASNMWSTYGAIDIAAANNYSSSTSDNDFIAGQILASPENIDTTTATTSTASPAQYKNLTAARTNARSALNKPLTIDNVVIGTPTGDAVTVTFDCANGVVAGQGSTVVSVDSALGQPSLSVANLTGFGVGDVVCIGYGTARFEVLRIASITSTLNFETNLAYNHTAAQADTVKKQMRNDALPFIRYGTAPGIYDMETFLPNVSEWGLLWTGFKTSVNGHPCAWKRQGHSVTIANLSPETTYYFKAYGITPLGEILESAAEYSFSTAVNTKFDDVPTSKVELGYQWKFNSNTPNRVGERRQPAASAVQHGYPFGPSDSLTGTYRAYDLWAAISDSDVRNSVPMLQDGVISTGRVVVAAPNTILKDTPSDTDGATLGTMVAVTPTTVLQLYEIWERLGLDPSNPLITTQTTVTAGAITMLLTGNDTASTLTRQP